MKIAILGAGLLLIYLGVTGRYRPVWEVFFPPAPQPTQGATS